MAQRVQSDESFLRAGPERAPAGSDEPADVVLRTDVDIEAEIESLQEFVLSGPSLLNHRHFLDLEEFQSRVEHVVSLLPREIRRARRICRDEQRIVQDAKEEARRLLEEARAEADHLRTTAREEADRMIEASAIRQRALEQSEETLTRANDTAKEIRENSYAYANQVVNSVVVSLKKLTETVEKDQSQLQQMRPEAEQAA